MNRHLLALCDRDALYLGRLDEYLRENLKLSFEIMSFTDTQILKRVVKTRKPALLLISEEAFNSLSAEMTEAPADNILILDEEKAGVREEGSAYEGSNVEHTSKYQPAGRIVDSVIDFCAKRSEQFKGLGSGYDGGNGAIYGFFTPISKCGQTALALKTGEELSKKGRTIFLSFESFSSLPRMLELKDDGSISDLIYYADGDESRFCLYLEKIKNRIGNLDVITPAKSGVQLKEIDCNSLKRLLDLLTQKAGYEYVVLDLTEYPSDFFEILRLCDRLFSITKANSVDTYRFEAYEELLKENGCEDVIAATEKISMSDIRDEVGLHRKARELADDREH